jgi:hypothetical protein
MKNHLAAACYLRIVSRHAALLANGSYHYFAYYISSSWEFFPRSASELPASGGIIFLWSHIGWFMAGFDDSNSRLAADLSATSDD